jgi:GxxExxY protein
MAVHSELGPGLREDSYQRALGAALEKAGLEFAAQRLYSVYTDPEELVLIGYYIPDFVVEEKIIVEIKALSWLDNSHLAQVIGYLAVSGCPLGLLINFGERSLKYRRIFPPQKIAQRKVNHQWLFVPDWLKTEKNSEQSRHNSANNA